MELDTRILSVVKTLPDNEIEGRKRLQKLIHLLQLSGLEVPAEFRIHNYGPFSEEVALAADDLVNKGALSESVKAVGVYGTHQYLYKLANPKKTKVAALAPHARKLVLTLDQFSTVELEVASTIGFFEAQGYSCKDAVEQTKSMKPNKTIPTVLDKAKKILELVKSSETAS